MKYLIVLLCLFAFAIPADAQCICGPDCKCNPCLCNDGDETSVSPASSAAASLAALMRTVKVKSSWEVYCDAYNAALAANKVLVVGVGCDTPPGDWLSVRIDELAPYVQGTVVVAKSDGKQMVVAGKLLAGASTTAVVQALATPPQATYAPQMMQMQPMMMGGFGGMMGGCAGGR